MKVKGLWSVKMVKERPSRMSRKCLMPEKQAHNLWLKALHFTWDGDSFFEKKPRGHHPWLPGSCCCRTAPTCEAEASTCRAKCATGCGCCRHVVLVKADLASWKARVISGVQDSAELGGNPPRSQSVRGSNVQAAFGTKRL